MVQPFLVLMEADMKSNHKLRLTVIMDLFQY